MLVEEVTVAMTENAGHNVRSSLLEDGTFRPPLLAMATVTSTISGAIGRRPLPRAILKSLVHSNFLIVSFKAGTERGPLRIL